MIKTALKAILLAYFSILMVTSPVLAQDGQALIKSYIEAIRADDDQAVKKVIETINENEDALALMKSEYKEVYKSFVFEEALVRLYEIEKKFALLDFDHEPIAGGKTSSGRELNNSDLAGFRDGSSNQQRVRNTSNRDRLRQRGASIGREAQRSPNQDRRPNSTRSVRQSQR